MQFKLPANFIIVAIRVPINAELYSSSSLPIEEIVIMREPQQTETPNIRINLADIDQRAAR